MSPPEDVAEGQHKYVNGAQRQHKIKDRGRQSKGEFNDRGGGTKMLGNSLINFSSTM